MKCRFCLKGSPSTNLFQLDLLIVRFIRDMLKIEKGSNDSYKMICKSCEGKLKNMEKFLTLCRESDEHLKNIAIATVTIKTETDLYTQTDLTSYSCDDVKVETGLMEIQYLDSAGLLLTADIYSKSDEENNDNESGIDNEDLNVLTEPEIDSEVLNVATEPEIDSEVLNVATEPEIDSEVLNVATEPEIDSEVFNVVKESHYIEHSAYECIECSTMWSCKKAYDRHMKKHNYPFGCTLCPAKYKTERSLNVHLKIHDRNTTINCPTCNIAYDGKRSLVEHASKVHKDDNTIMDKIEYCIKNRDNRAHAPQSLLCLNCGKVCGSIRALKIHESTHYEKKFQCDICSKTYHSKERIKQHINTHSKVEPYACHICPRKFKSVSYQKTHIRRTHMKIDKCKSAFCHICNKSFSSTSSLKYHNAIHAGEKSEECSVCHKMFRGKTSLNNHLRYHSKERPHVCSFCGKKFLTPDCLTQHERLHTGETPYKCPVCLRGYAQRCNMKSHFVHNHKELDYKQEMEKYKLKMKQTST